MAGRRGAYKRRYPTATHGPTLHKEIARDITNYVKTYLNGDDALFSHYTGYCNCYGIVQTAWQLEQDGSTNGPLSRMILNNELIQWATQKQGEYQNKGWDTGSLTPVAWVLTLVDWRDVATMFSSITPDERN